MKPTVTEVDSTEIQRGKAAETGCNRNLVMASSTLRRSIGPGILLAGACIGGSHLMSSTTAGARFGFALVGLILLTNLIKYPFLRVGTRFTAATGLSLLEGFQKRNSLYLPLYLVVSLVTGTFTIAAVSFVAGLLLTNIPLLAGLDPYGLSIAVLVVSGLVLLLGHYRALDRLSKLLVVLLTLLTGVAAASLLIRGPVGDVAASWVSTDPSPWTLANLAFLIPLMGWMPGPVEMCVWPSLWMFSRARDTDHTATPKEAEFDFNLGYSVTVVTAMFFVILGAYTMYGSGDGMLAGSGVSFAQKLIKLYTAAMGGWAAWVIIPAAFSAMFSTTLTCLDAYPRSIAAIQGLLRHHDSGDSAPGPYAASLRHLGDRAFPGRCAGAGGGQERRDRGEGFRLRGDDRQFPHRSSVRLDGDGHDQQPLGSLGAPLWATHPGLLLVWPGVFQWLQPAVHRPLLPGPRRLIPPWLQQKTPAIGRGWASVLLVLVGWACPAQGWSVLGT
jgi:Mn2+/Fe2+ NRAMP family transporter